MELKRVPAASTFIVFPLVDDTGKGVATLTSGSAQWVAWDDGGGSTGKGPGAPSPNGWSLQPCAFTNEVYQVVNPAVSLFQLQLASTELPAASPYVMVVVRGSNVATQYILINTATTYATLASLTHTGAVVAVDQTAAISSGTANSIGEAFRFVHHASNYLGDRNIGGASIYATLRTITHTGAVVPTTVTVDASGYVTITTTAETHLIRMIWNETVAAFTGFPTKTREFLYWMRQVFKNKLDYVKGTDTMTLYEDDGTTAKSAHTMTDDASNATRGAGA